MCRLLSMIILVAISFATTPADAQSRCPPVCMKPQLPMGGNPYPPLGPSVPNSGTTLGAPVGPPGGYYRAPAGPPGGFYGAPAGPPGGFYGAPAGPPGGFYGAPAGPPGGYYDGTPAPSPSPYQPPRAYTYSCTVDDDQDDAGGSCRVRSNSPKDTGDFCRCHGQRGTID